MCDIIQQQIDAEVLKQGDDNVRKRVGDELRRQQESQLATHRHDLKKAGVL